MRATAVLASALVRLATVLTAAVPGGYGGGGGYGGEGGGEGEDGGEGGGEGEDGGGGAGQVETGPWTPVRASIAQEQTLDPELKTLGPCVPAVLPVMVHDDKVTVPPFM